jgi:chromosome segregation ATPase
MDDTKSRQRRTEQRIKTLNRRMREFERDIDAAYVRINEWQNLKIQSWRRRSGESVGASVAYGTVNSVLIGRQIAGERRHLRNLYKDLYGLEHEAEAALEELERNKAEAAEAQAQEADAMRLAIAKLTEECRNLMEEAQTSRASVQQAYAEIKSLESYFEVDRSNEKLEYGELGEQMRKLYQQLADARAELEEWRMREQDRRSEPAHEPGERADEWESDYEGDPRPDEHEGDLEDEDERER